MKIKSRILQTLFIFIPIIGILHSCTNQSNCCTIVDINNRIHYQNSLGENLINSSSEFDESKIKIYYKNGDKYDYALNGQLDHPNMHFVYSDSNDNLILTIFPSRIYEGTNSTTLIELNENVVDTLFCEFNFDNNNIICTNSWLNGVSMDNRFIEVRK